MRRLLSILIENDMRSKKFIKRGFNTMKINQKNLHLAIN